MIDLDAAIETAVRGFCFVRSRKRPYRANKMGDIWVLRDDPGSDRRKTEVFAHSLLPEETIRQIRSSVAEWHFLCYVHSDPADFSSIRGEFKALGYRALATEWLFVRDTEGFPIISSVPPVKRITEFADAELVRKANGRVEIQNKYLGIDDAPQRLYAAIARETVYGWVSSIPVAKNAWVSNLYVPKEHRGHGYGRALMSALLGDDHAFGIEHSVLLASKDGARLYPHVGYLPMGTMQIFCPASRLPYLFT